MMTYFFSARGFGHPVFLKPDFGHPVMKILAKTLPVGTVGPRTYWCDLDSDRHFSIKYFLINAWIKKIQEK